MPGPQLCYAHRQRAEPFRPTPRPPPLMGRLLSRASPAQKAPLLGVTPRCAGRCREATEGFGSEGLAESARPEGSRRASRGRPSTGIHPLTPAAAWGQAALRTPFKLACRGGGLTLRGASGTPHPTAFTTTLLSVVGGGIPPGKAFLTPRSSHPRQNRVWRSGLKSHASAWAKSRPPGASLSDFPR